MQIPPPTEGAEFENIVQDALKIRWGNQDLQLIGRSGQGQEGVDIYGFDDFGQMAGVQCKKRSVRLTMKVIKEETLKADTFDPALDVLYFATTQVLDAPLQQAVRLYSRQRVKDGKFPVMLLFWDDILKSLVTNRNVLRVHYPMLAGGRGSEGDISEYKLFSLFDLVFYGRTLDHWANLLFGEWSWMLGVDQYHIFQYCALIRAAATQLLGPAERERLEAPLAAYEKIVHGILVSGLAKHEADRQFEEREATATQQDWLRKRRADEEYAAQVQQRWKETEVYANRLASATELLRAPLSSRALAVFELAALLAGWELREDQDERPHEAKEAAGVLTPAQQQQLRELVERVAPAASESVADRLTHYNADMFSRGHMAESVFRLVHKELVLDEIRLG